MSIRSSTRGAVGAMPVSSASSVYAGAEKLGHFEKEILGLLRDVLVHGNHEGLPKSTIAHVLNLDESQVERVVSALSGRHLLDINERPTGLLRGSAWYRLSDAGMARLREEPS